MMKVAMWKKKTVPYSELAVGDCFAYEEKAYIKIATGALDCSGSDFTVQSVGASTTPIANATQVIPYQNSVLTLN